MPAQRQVVIVHGWSDTSKSFLPLAKFLEAYGSALKLEPSDALLSKRFRVTSSTYATVHMILGWLLVPFIAASIAARFRRRGGSA